MPNCARDYGRSRPEYKPDSERHVFTERWDYSAAWAGVSCTELEP